MLRALESGRYLSMAFRSWDLYEFPLLQRTTKHSWAIKTATQLGETAIRNLRLASWPEKHYVRKYKSIRPLQIKLNNVKLYLNSECYPMI